MLSGLWINNKMQQPDFVLITTSTIITTNIFVQYFLGDGYTISYSSLMWQLCNHIEGAQFVAAAIEKLFVLSPPLHLFSQVIDGTWGLSYFS